MKTEYQYIHFIHVPTPTRKTERYFCHNLSGGDMLGVVEWYGPWRQYCFAPVGLKLTEIVLSKGCMEDVCDFISQLMEARKG